MSRRAPRTINRTVSQSGTGHRTENGRRRYDNVGLRAGPDGDWGLRYTMSFTSRSESPEVSPAASIVQKYTPLSHHITSVMTRSASGDTETYGNI